MITRRNGKTIVDLGNVTIKTTLINRHKHNRLRKKPIVSVKDIFLVLRKEIRRK